MIGGQVQVNVATYIRFSNLLLHLVATGHDQEFHVSGHLRVRVGHDVLLEGGVEPAEYGPDVRSGGGIVGVKVDKSFVEVGVLHLQSKVFDCQCQDLIITI